MAFYVRRRRTSYLAHGFSIKSWRQTVPDDVYTSTRDVKSAMYGIERDGIERRRPHHEELHYVKITVFASWYQRVNSLDVAYLLPKSPSLTS